MKRDEILKILIDWNFWVKEQETGIERKFYKEKLLEFLDTDFIISVIGVRRSGKSTIIKQIAKEISEKYGKENVLIVNFEDRRFVKLDASVLDEIFKVYLEEIRPTQRPIIFLDEIQKVKDWEGWVRTMHELKKAKIVISGSTSQLTKGKLATLLTGRHLDVEVYPLSFKEFLQFKNLELKSRLEILEKESNIKSLLKEYLEFGGFPEVVLKEKFKREILQTYFDDIITRDIVEKYNIRKIEDLKTLAKFYFSNIGSYMTYSSIKNFLGLSKETIQRFSNYIEETFTLFFVKMFDFSLKKQEKAPRKIYCVDNGLPNAIGFRISENLGKLMENMVFLELFKKFKEVYYWKEYGKAEGKEVDFVIKEGIQIKQLIQVTYASNKDEIDQREIKALEKAYELFKKDKPELLIITWDYEDILKKDNLEIKCIPLWKWLLNL